MIPTPPSQSWPAFPCGQALLQDHLKTLQARHGMALWMITRVRDQEMVLLQVCGDHYQLQPGQRLDWQASYCMRMVEQGAAPVATDTRQHPAYQTASINQQLTIGAYIGLPLVGTDGQLFGTLCALDPQPQPQQLEQALPALQHDAALISWLLNQALREAEQQRLTTFIEHPDRCELTDLPGPQGWQDIYRQEQSNCRNFGLRASALYLQGPDGGDCVTIADSLAALLREQDSIAHQGNNRFAILLTDVDNDQALRVADRIRDALNAKQQLVRIHQEVLIPELPR